eukprot:2567875-Lingulodinium_polyedra.AAC.1
MPTAPPKRCSNSGCTSNAPKDRRLRRHCPSGSPGAAGQSPARRRRPPAGCLPRAGWARTHA